MEIKLQDIEAEQAIIAGAFIRPAVINEIRGELSPKDFTDERCRTIYQGILNVFDGIGDKWDLLTLKNELEKSGTLEKAGGEDYLMSFIDAVSTSAGIMYHVKQVKEARAKYSLVNLFEETKNSLKRGEEVGDTLIDLQKSINKMSTGGYIGLDPFEPLTKHLGDKYERDMSRDPDRRLGYDLRGFERLAKNIDGIQPGFYVVGAETNAGKTAFLCNLTLDLLYSNRNLTGIYFSLDDSRDVILNRLLGINTGIPLNKVQRPQPGVNQEEMLKGGYDHLTTLAKQERLFIRDSSEIRDIQDLEIEIKRRLKGDLFVVIDALYNLDIGVESDQRRENIERANRLKALANTYSIPVICTGELRKSKDRREHNKPPLVDDLMETGKFAYNASLVLLIYPDRWEDYDNEDEPILKLKYAKNKLSHYRGIQELKFIRKTGQLEEMEHGLS